MIILKSPEEVKKIGESNAIVAEVLTGLREKIRPGVTTLKLNEYAEGVTQKRGAKPAFKGYGGFPFALCASVNSEVVHGFPSDRSLEEGDIISLDYGVYYKGYYGDSAITVAVGRISASASRLMKVTEESLYKGIEKAREGNRLGDISFAVQSCVESAGFSVVRDYVGHGIGKDLHEDPPVPNFGVGGRGVKLKAGMVIAIEPMVNEGSYMVKTKPDGWTVVTDDGSLSAHFEHTIAVTEDGPVILSSPDMSGHPRALEE
ncbi:MAG: type I methionyl aminopeptidase [Deltaproteobacteria bacterium]|nr:type I methionyl aminopeptidase [Deltaproteobacteria bacterium]MBW2594981.1 type I methionyl aminopeptidase [Deltaproteobacteria bacterium]MBW2649654.1 type I methionyl aminopeptidase [Deltaproteobacteria bacterium]